MGSRTAVKTARKFNQIEQKPISGNEFYAMGDIGPSELINGRIVRHIPTGHPHGFIENLIAFFLTLFNQEHQLGRVLTGEVGIYTKRGADTVRAADVAFISHQRFQQVQSTGFLDVAPELVVEIMSPGNSWSEVQQKLAEYFAIDVKIVWVIDPQLEQAHVYHSLERITLLKKMDTLTGESLLPGLTIALKDIFVDEKLN